MPFLGKLFTTVYLFAIFTIATAADTRDPQTSYKDKKSQNKCTPEIQKTVQDYFLPKFNAGYVYNKLDANSAGNKKAKHVIYYSRGIIDGEVNYFFETIHFVESMKIKRVDVYAIVCDSVYQTSNENQLSGKTVYTIRPVVLKLPTQGKAINWSWTGENDRSEVHNATATYLENYQTPLKIFDNVLIVKDVVTHKDGKYVIKYYYAKGYGLIKNEWYVDGKIFEDLSGNLAEINQ